MSVQWGDGAAKGGCGIEGRAREGAHSSIAAGPGFSALLNPARHLAAVSVGAHAVPRGGTDTLRAARRPLGRSGGLHLQLRRPLPGAGQGVPSQPQSSSTRPAAFLALRGWEVGGGGGISPSPLRRRLLVSRLRFHGPSERTGGPGPDFQVYVSAGSLGGDRGEPRTTLYPHTPDFAWGSARLTPGIS